MGQATDMLAGTPVHALADPDLSALRFHRRFAFAPGAFEHHAAQAPGFAAL